MYLVYGVGKLGKIFASKLRKKSIFDVIFTDSNENEWGKSIEGFTIVSPREAFTMDLEKIIISSSTYFEEIREKLIGDYKIASEMIFNRTDIVPISGRENLGDLHWKNGVIPGIYTKQEVIAMINADNLGLMEDFWINGSHTGLNKHIHYYEAYERFFSKFKGDEPVRILEIGICQGGSLQLWKNYFGADKVQVYGIDIDPNCKQYEEENIKIFIGSQDDVEFLRSVKEQVGWVDIILDDGGHTMDMQITSLKELFSIVRDGGIYLCEDTHTSYWRDFGGGLRCPGTFMEYVKELMDTIHCLYYEDDATEKHPDFKGIVKSISVFDSMVFIEKQSKVEGDLSFMLDTLEE